MIKQVLVGIDFSESSLKALEHGVFWARKLGVPLIAMHVLQVVLVTVPVGFPGALDLPRSQEIEEHALAQLQRIVQPFPFARAKTIWGNPAEDLVQEAGSDTRLVIAQMGHSSLHHLFFGSTAARVVRQAACDVLVVRREAA